MPLDMKMLLKMYFLFFSQSIMLWVLKRAISLRWFFRVPKSYVQTDRLEKNQILSLKKRLHIWIYATCL